ncbi:DinB family protein [Streptomyces sp. NPDC001493]
MSRSQPKDDLRSYLQEARDTLLLKLEGLSDYDVRRPLTPTGTNLLGLVKHLSGVELGYFGETFDRPSDEPFPWLDEGAEDNADMWATEDESREEVVARYRRVWQHSDATIAALPLDAIGVVPWWSEAKREVTLHRILVHVTTETHRHAGHADIVREFIDGEVGYRSRGDNLPEGEATWWKGYVDRLERTARTFRSDRG